MLQMTEAPTVHPYNGSSLLVPMYATSSVQVLREEEAFSFGDLVADCGGVLGLFVGFNFLMVWDWLINAVTTFRYKHYVSLLNVALTRKQS